MKGKIHYRILTENHNHEPLCHEQEKSRSMSRSITLIDCPDCLKLLDCSWCNGRGYFMDYSEKQICQQCEGTGFAHKVEP